MKNFKSFVTAYRNCTIANETIQELEKSFENEISNVPPALITEVYKCRAQVLAQILEVQYILNDEINDVCPKNVIAAKAQEGFVCKEFFAFWAQHPDLIGRAKDKLMDLIGDMVENPDDDFEVDENVAEVVKHITARSLDAAMAKWSENDKPI